MSCWISWRPRPTAPPMPRPAPPSPQSPRSKQAGASSRRRSASARQADVGASAAQAQAVVQTAQQLADKNKPKRSNPRRRAKPRSQTPRPKPPPPSRPSPAGPPRNRADRFRSPTANAPAMARHQLQGRRRHAVAVFVRGLTAWVVLENAPAFDAPQSQSRAGRFRRRAGSGLQQRPWHPAHHPEAARRNRGARRRARI